MSEDLKKIEELLENDRKIIEENYKEIEKLTKTLEKIRTIINNEKITGIEAKLMIKDILEEK